MRCMILGNPSDKSLTDSKGRVDICDIKWISCAIWTIHAMVVVIRRWQMGEKIGVWYKPHDLRIASHTDIYPPPVLLLLIAITNYTTNSGILWTLLISVQSLKGDLPGLFSIITIFNSWGPCAFLVVGGVGSGQIRTKWYLPMRKSWFLSPFFINQLGTFRGESEVILTNTINLKTRVTRFYSLRESLFFHRILTQDQRKW